MKKRMKWIAVGLMICASAVHADLVTAISNFGASGSSGNAYDDDVLLALKFTTGDDGGLAAWGDEWSISVRVNDGTYPSGNGYIGLYWVQDEHDTTPGAPDSAWGTALTSDLVDGLVSVTSSDLSHDLRADDEYFLVLSTAAFKGADAYTTTDTSHVDAGASAGWSLGGSLWKSTDGGGTWSEDTSQTLQAGIAVIPEPATVSLIGLAGISMIAVHRIKRRRKEAGGEE